MIARLLERQVVRFGLVSLAGLTVDMAAAWAVLRGLDAPLPLAALAGFLCGALFNYALHEGWTFATATPSLRRGALYGAVLGATLATRVGTVAALDRLAGHAPALAMPILLVAVGVSFTVNYTLSRTVVFR